MVRDLGELDTAMVVVDGICFADHCCVNALTVTADGTKVQVGCGWAADPVARAPVGPTGWS